MVIPDIPIQGGAGLGSPSVQGGSFACTYIFRTLGGGTRTKPLHGNRVRELAWRREHGDELRAFAGEWVALEGNRIVAHGPDAVRVVTAARAQGIRVPYVFLVEDLADDVVMMGL